ncbi:hypothetical protein [Streptomyces shenzhenensis]|nr:hypothetical protein [Streptomyces shenzhenensis]
MLVTTDPLNAGRLCSASRDGGKKRPVSRSYTSGKPAWASASSSST